MVRTLKDDTNQNRKDIHRDHITLNGKYFRGSELGYENLIDSLAKALAGDQALAVRSVSIGCRTFSGGVSLAAVLDAFSYGDYVVVPESAQAKPIDFLASGNAVLVRAHTRYSLRAADDAEVVHSLIDAVFLCDVSRGLAAVNIQVLDAL